MPWYKAVLKLDNLLYAVVLWAISLCLFGCGPSSGSSKTDLTALTALTAHNERGPLKALTLQPTVWILGDNLITNWQTYTTMENWTFYPPSQSIAQDPTDDVLGLLNHLLLGTPTGEPSNLPSAPPVPSKDLPDLLVILSGTMDTLQFTEQDQPDHGPCQGGIGMPESPQIPTSPCEALLGLVTQAHQAGIKIVFLTLPITTNNYQDYTPLLASNEQRFNLYLTTTPGQDLTSFGEDATIDLSAKLARTGNNNWTDDGLTLNRAGAAIATKVLQDYISQLTATR